MSTRPMSNLSTEYLCERIKCADADAIREGVYRYVNTDRAKTVRLVGESLPADVHVDAETQRAARIKGDTPVTADAPVVTDAPAPVAVDVSTETLALAIAQAVAQVLASNTLAPVVGADKPEPAPAPVQAPEPDAPKASRKPRPRKASGLFAERVKALAANDERVSKGIRATKLAKREGWTLADVQAFSDEECLTLVSKPVV
jgi:hypothetical protein